MNKTVIKKIEFTPEIQAEIDNINKGLPTPKTKIITNKNGSTYDITYNKRFSYSLSKRRLRELYGGLCVLCAAWPSYKVSYDVDGAKLIERYCESCYSQWQQRIKKTND